MLSPVSKFERAKQMARLEQRKRIDAACSEEVTSKIANTKKRKQVERRLERPGGYANVKKKIKSQDEAELFISKPTRSRRTSRQVMVEEINIAQSLMTKKPIRAASERQWTIRQKSRERQARVVLPQDENSEEEYDVKDEVIDKEKVAVRKWFEILVRRSYFFEIYHFLTLSQLFGTLFSLGVIVFAANNNGADDTDDNFLGFAAISIVIGLSVGGIMAKRHRKTAGSNANSPICLDDSDSDVVATSKYVRVDGVLTAFQVTSLEHLEPLGWLNEDCIEIFSSNQQSSTAAAFVISKGTFDVWKSNGANCKGIRKYVSKLLNAEQTLWLVPINTGGSHWILLAVVRPGLDNPYMAILDSFNAPQSKNHDAFEFGRVCMHHLTSSVDYVPSESHTKDTPIRCTPVPKQTNSYDCGVYVLLNIRYAIENITSIVEAPAGVLDFSKWYDPSISAAYRKTLYTMFQHYVFQTHEFDDKKDINT